MAPLRLAFVVATIVLLPAAVTRTPAFDPDTWWHLRVGKEITEAGTVPLHDHYSRLSQEQPTEWIAYSWLYEWGLYEAYSHGGPAGVLWVRAALGALSAAAVLRLLTRRSAVGRIVVPAAILIGVTLVPLMRERPWHLTVALTVATAAAVENCRSGARLQSVAWLPMVFVLWANLHIQFVLGWLILGLACLFPGSADRRPLAALTAACVLATFVNPYHVRLLGVVWDYATQTGPLRGVQELAPPDPTHPWTWAGLGLIALGGWVVARRRPIDWFHVAFLVVALVLMLRMRRDVWVAAVAVATVIPNRSGEPLSAIGRTVVWATVAAVFAAVRAVASIDSEPANADRFPVRAVEYVRDHEPPGPLFNSFSWGGYLIWALPDYPVSIDGRTNLYGSERVTRALATWAGEPGWDTDPDLATARLVIAPRGWPLTDQLRNRPTEWRIAFEDDTAIVFIATR